VSKKDGQEKKVEKTSILSAEEIQKEREIDEAADVMTGLELLEDLIRCYYKEVKKKFRKNFKSGDFVRMVELRYRLSPTDAEQRKFWTMLANIRREVLKDMEEIVMAKVADAIPAGGVENSEKGGEIKSEKVVTDAVGK
jgi:hypothetical protein